MQTFPAGSVVLVGGGPGDPGLMTVAGLDAIRAADVVVHDRLGALKCLSEAREDAEVVNVGKIPRGAFTPQEEINSILVDRARKGLRVVRLKGGDNFVFGRGGEEVLACRDAGVECRVIPGVTSAVSVPALAGIPVTHRGTTQGFVVVSGHVPPGDPRSDVNWAALAQANLTLVVLMGVQNLPAIADELMSHGLSPTTPAAVVADGTTPDQVTLKAPLGEIARAAADVRPPAIVVVGDVAGLDLGELGAAAAHRPEPRTALVLGGARSGKSSWAEQQLAGRDDVEYVATSAVLDDPEWEQRVALHRERRPATWRTTETQDLPAVLAADDPAPVLIDCAALWLDGVLGAVGAWDDAEGWRDALATRVTELTEAVRTTRREVLVVSNEVGSGVVPATPAGRLYRDELGRLNTALAAACREVWLLTAGIPQQLK